MGAAAASQNVKSRNGRSLVPGGRRHPVRRLTRGLCIGLGAALAVCATFATVVAAAAWIVRSTLDSHSYVQAPSKFAVAAADRHPGLTDSYAAADPAPKPKIATSTAALNAMVFSGMVSVSAASAATPPAMWTPASRVTPSDSKPAPAWLDTSRQGLERELAYAPAATEIAEPVPAAPPQPVPAEAEVGERDPKTAAPPLPRPHPAKQQLARTPPQGEAAELTTGSIPDATLLQDPDAKASIPRQSNHRVAVYDISARVVYLPSGERLEAHSGLGERMDDPRHVRVKNKGPTPPNVYDLTLRERLFHGVKAIRLNPVDEGKMFGRDGMLAHTYLLGPSGQSNGCVSFKNYARFLRAFERGQIDRLVVVASLGSESWRTVAARARLVRRYASNRR